MKIIYDNQKDILTFLLSDRSVAESDEGKSGAILDYDVDGNLVSLEILDASLHVELPTQIDYRVVSIQKNKKTGNEMIE